MSMIESAPSSDATPIMHNRKSFPFHATTTTRSTRRRPRRRHSSSKTNGCVKLLWIGAICGAMLVGGWRQTRTVVVAPNAEKKPYQPARRPERHLRPPPTPTNKLPSLFPSLKIPMAKSQITLLYFAASWCRMSTPITQLLDDTFQSILLNETDHRLSIVHVPSDTDPEKVQAYLRPGWDVVSLQHTEEVRFLKRHYQTCAAKEVSGLQPKMTRTYEIPNVVVLDSQTGATLHPNAIDDLKQYQQRVLERWLALRQDNVVEQE